MGLKSILLLPYYNKDVVCHSTLLYYLIFLPLLMATNETNFTTTRKCLADFLKLNYKKKKVKSIKSIKSIEPVEALVVESDVKNDSEYTVKRHWNMDLYKGINNIYVLRNFLSITETIEEIKAYCPECWITVDFFMDHPYVNDALFGKILSDSTKMLYFNICTPEDYKNDGPISNESIIYPKISMDIVAQTSISLIFNKPFNTILYKFNIFSDAKIFIPFMVLEQTTLQCCILDNIISVIINCNDDVDIRLIMYRDYSEHYVNEALTDTQMCVKYCTKQTVNIFLPYGININNITTIDDTVANELHLGNLFDVNAQFDQFPFTYLSSIVMQNNLNLTPQGINVHTVEPELSFKNYKKNLEKDIIFNKPFTISIYSTKLNICMLTCFIDNEHLENLAL